MTSRGFVCVFSGKRDSYQVPLGLRDAGLLDRLVTDFYAPGPGRNLLPEALASRYDERLPRSQTVSVWHAFALSVVVKRFRLRQSILRPALQRILGKTASRVAKKRGSDLYCYHTYFPDWVPDGARLIVFVFHPLPAVEREILSRDAELFPEIARSARAICEGSLADDLPIDWERADAVVCASNFTARSVIADGCPAEKIAVIPYGLPESSPALPEATSGPREGDGVARFLFVGQGVQRKGLHHLVRAWEAWREQTDLRARLVIVSYYIDPEIRPMIDHPEIELLGYQTREELNRRFAEADVFVLPSLVEGFGLVYLEALAHGCHVIGTKNTGLPELPLGDDDRTLVEAGSISSLVDGLDRCARKAIEGSFDREAIQASAARWTQADFRKRIGEHARATLAAARR